MDHQTASEQPFSTPIDPDWTIEQLLARLAPLDSPDESLQPALARLECAIRISFEETPWNRQPSAVAILRSIASLCVRTPALRALTVRQALADAAILASA